MKIRIEIEQKTFQQIQNKLERYDKLFEIAETMHKELTAFEYKEGPPRIDLDETELAEFKKMNDLFDEAPAGLSKSAADEVAKCVKINIAQDILEKVSEFLDEQRAYEPLDLSCIHDFEMFKLGLK